MPNDEIDLDRVVSDPGYRRQVIVVREQHRFQRLIPSLSGLRQRDPAVADHDHFFYICNLAQFCSPCQPEEAKVTHRLWAINPGAGR